MTLVYPRRRPSAAAHRGSGRSGDGQAPVDEALVDLGVGRPDLAHRHGQVLARALEARRPTAAAAA